MSLYFYAKDGKPFGPLPLHVLGGMRQSGELAADASVWSNETRHWTPLVQVLAASADGTLALPTPRIDPMPQRTEPTVQPAPVAILAASADGASATPALRIDPTPQRTEPRVQPAPEVVVVKAADPHPWRRFWARIVDINSVGVFTYGLFVLPFLVFTHDQKMLEAVTTNQVVAAMAAQFLMVPVMALLCWLTGSTFGKALLGIRVLNADGTRPRLGLALQREWLVYLHGVGLGFPLANLIFMGGSRDRLRKKGVTLWDEQLGLKVTCSESNWVALGALVAIFYLGAIWTVLAALDKVH